MAESRLRGGLAAALALVVLATGCTGQDGQPNTASVVEVGSDGMHGTLLPPGSRYAVPPVTLVDTDGDPYTLASDDAHELTLVFFGYTRCPDICQAVMSELASAVTRLGEQRDDVGVTFVTTDPARDDAATLTSYLRGYNPEFVGVTGDLDDIIDLALPMAINVSQGAELPSGGYEVDHTASILGVRDGEVEIVWGQLTSAAKFAEDLAVLLAPGGTP